MSMMYLRRRQRHNQLNATRSLTVSRTRPTRDALCRTSTNGIRCVSQALLGLTTNERPHARPFNNVVPNQIGNDAKLETG